MPRPDEGMIHAWLDGELSAEEAERVAKLVAEDAEWGAAAAEARGLVAASSRIVGALDVIPAGVMPEGSRAAPTKRPRLTVKPWMRMAAGVVLVVGTATAVLTRTANTPAPGEIVFAPGPGSAMSADEAPTATSSSVLAASVPAAPAAVAAKSATEEDRATASQRDRQSPSSDRAASSVDSLARAKPTDAAQASRAAVAEAAAPAVTSLRVEGEQRSREPSSAGVGASSEVGKAAVAPQLRRDLRMEAAADATASLAGCWRVEVPGRADSVIVEPRIARQVGDTLTIVVAADGRTAAVRREGGDRVRGVTQLASVAPVPFVGTRVDCPRAP